MLCLPGRAAIATGIAIGKPLPQARTSAAECNNGCIVIGKLQMNSRARSRFLFLTIPNVMLVAPVGSVRSEALLQSESRQIGAPKVFVSIDDTRDVGKWSGCANPIALQQSVKGGVRQCLGICSARFMEFLCLTAYEYIQEQDQCGSLPRSLDCFDQNQYFLIFPNQTASPFSQSWACYHLGDCPSDFSLCVVPLCLLVLHLLSVPRLSSLVRAQPVKNPTCW